MTSTGTISADPTELIRLAQGLESLARRLDVERVNLCMAARTTSPADSTAAAAVERAASELPVASIQLRVAADVAGEVAGRISVADQGSLPAAHTSLDYGDLTQHLLRLGNGALQALPDLAGLAHAVPALAPLLTVLEGPLATVAPLAGVAIVGNDLLELVHEGDPRDAWRRDGTAYAAKVAHALSDTSLLALTVAPSPLSLTAAVGSTALWLNLESYNHGWPVLIPPLPPIDLQALESGLHTLDHALPQILNAARREVRGFGDIARRHGSAAVTDLLNGDVPSAGGQVITGLIDFADRGLSLVAATPATGLYALFG